MLVLGESDLRDEWTSAEAKANSSKGKRTKEGGEKGRGGSGGADGVPVGGAHEDECKA